MLIGEVTELIGIDRVVAKRLRVLLQTDPAEPPIDVQDVPGSCQRQFSKMIESWRPAVIPRVFPTNLEFAMWTPTTRQQHSRPVTRYHDRSDRRRVACDRAALAEALLHRPAARVADA